MRLEEEEEEEVHRLRKQIQVNEQEDERAIKFVIHLVTFLVVAYILIKLFGVPS